MRHLLQVSEMVHASEAVILHGGAAGDTERALLRTRVGDFLRRMCSLATAAGDEEAVALASKIVTLSAAALPRTERLHVPLPAADHPDENDPPGEDDGGDDDKPSAYVRLSFLQFECALIIYTCALCAHVLSLLH
jgi:hypothetical protein